MTGANAPAVDKKTTKLLEVRKLCFVRWQRGGDATMAYWCLYWRLSMITDRARPWWLTP